MEPVSVDNTTDRTKQNNIGYTGVRKDKRRTEGGSSIREGWRRQHQQSTDSCTPSVPVQSSAVCRQSDEVVCERERSSFAPHALAGRQVSRKCAFRPTSSGQTVTLRSRSTINPKHSFQTNFHRFSLVNSTVESEFRFSNCIPKSRYSNLPPPF